MPALVSYKGGQSQESANTFVRATIEIEEGGWVEKTAKADRKNVGSGYLGPIHHRYWVLIVA